ncbi:metal ABC transporter ATP-binding protein [Thermosediminibacter oceani]|uniref:ABC transporter related protein n=1 Tax=Thermosediminibacter oceani (strain ATCC BAA-1034 / DSM 16646 / JW/IW-1228P) TaxID=555079 RepID=D9RZF8_THEOJ|nr:metal ABC transporter ATP-binding protein [Thermosediminibacter oceani]ADL06856.1 ABC transporter related protein [Thermosediminibacter oceani DSM 16646]
MKEENKKTPVVELQNVTFSYNGPPVLEGVSLRVERGDFMALIGPNGAAKSTLMKIMVGLLTPNRGTVRLFGEDIRKFRQWYRIGYVPQQGGHVNLAFPATVEEAVASGLYGGFMKFFKGQEIDKAVREAMATVGIEHLARSLLGELSGGQRQKVFLARSLVKKPEALFLDEPTAGIDPESQEEFYSLLKNLNELHGITVVMITHDIGMAYDRATRIGCVGSRKVDVHENIKDITEDHIAEVMGYRIKKKRH